MASNPRQIQSFETNPMFVWKYDPNVESYTFRLERKNSPFHVIWERTLYVSDAKEIIVPAPGETDKLETSDIPDKLGLERFKNAAGSESLMFTYSKDLPALDESTPYLISVIGKCKDNNIIAQAHSEIIVFEKSARVAFENFRKTISDLNKDSLNENFRVFREGITMGLNAASGSVPPWYRSNCYPLGL
jgi:hypothetical protein